MTNQGIAGSQSLLPRVNVIVRGGPSFLLFITDLCFGTTQTYSPSTGGGTHVGMGEVSGQEVSPQSKWYTFPPVTTLLATQTYFPYSRTGGGYFRSG